MMNKYELALVITPTIDDEARNAEIAKVQELIERFGGKIEKVDDWGKGVWPMKSKSSTKGFTASPRLTRPPKPPRRWKAAFASWKTFSGISLSVRRHSLEVRI